MQLPVPLSMLLRARVHKDLFSPLSSRRGHFDFHLKGKYTIHYYLDFPERNAIFIHVINQSINTFYTLALPDPDRNATSSPSASIKILFLLFHIFGFSLVFLFFECKALVFKVIIIR